MISNMSPMCLCQRFMLQHCRAQSACILSASRARRIPWLLATICLQHGGQCSGV